MQKCNEDQDLEEYPEAICPDQETVDNFIDNFTVEVWTVTEKIFFDKRFEKPIYHNLQFLTQTNGNPKKLIET